MDGPGRGIFRMAFRWIRDWPFSGNRSSSIEGYVWSGRRCIAGDWMGRITAAFLIGAALGGGVFGWLGDRIGRVRALTLSILTYSIFSGAGYFAHAPWHLALFRFLAAIGMGGEWAVGVALVMECWPDKYRPLLAGVIGAAANVGIFLVGLCRAAFYGDQQFMALDVPGRRLAGTSHLFNSPVCA